MVNRGETASYQGCAGPRSAYGEYQLFRAEQPHYPIGLGNAGVGGIYRTRGGCNRPEPGTLRTHGHFGEEQVQPAPTLPEGVSWGLLSASTRPTSHSARSEPAMSAALWRCSAGALAGW